MGRSNTFSGGVVCAVALALAGCGGGDAASPPPAPAAAGEGVSIVQPGEPGEPSRQLDPDKVTPTATAQHTRADVEFMQGMLHHHAQALVMTRLARANREGEGIATFALRTELSQESEMELMKEWLTSRGERVPTAEEHEHEHGPGGVLMPGMVGLAQLERLASARGSDFDHRFLRLMARHHQGALTMVADVRAAGGGLEPEIENFTRHVESDQAIELRRMEDIRAELPPASATPAGAAADGTGWGGKPPQLCILA